MRLKKGATMEQGASGSSALRESGALPATLGSGVTFERRFPSRKPASRPSSTGDAAEATRAPAAALARGQTPRIARMLALAHQMKRLVDQGDLRDYSELARLGGVSTARITQIMSLVLLAPEIQEEVLLLPRVLIAKDAITERELRRVARVPEWERQQPAWKYVRERSRPTPSRGHLPQPRLRRSESLRSSRTAA